MKTSAFLLFALSVGCHLQAAEISEGARQCHEWFTTLGIPEVKDAKWAEVTQTFDSLNGDEDGTKKLHGFIVEETDKNFTILLPDLTVKTMLRGVSNIEFVVRGTYEERPFPLWAADQVKALQNPPKDGFRRFGAHLGHKTEVFAVSHFCWQRGEAGLAAKLYAEAEKLPVSLHGYERKKTVSDMRESLEIELGHAAMWDAVLRMGGGSLAGGSWGGGSPLQPREQVLEAFRRIVRLFPRCEHIERAKATIATLERMVAEDAKHPMLTQQQLDALPLEKRIAELVWMLRDQNGHQMSQPGWCDVLGYDAKGTSPGHQLLQIGYPAAPALIEALTDDRFSRSVGFHRNFHFSHTILTIGDCAQQILQKISGQNFYSPGSTSGYMSNEDKMLAVQKAARAWWDGYQKKGLKQMLVDDISSGQKSPYALVEQLKKEDASAVEAAVLAGAAKASTDWMTSEFIDQLESLKSTQSITALAKIMKEHSNLEVRLDAAARLLNHDHPDTLNALLHEWSAYPPAKADHDRAFEAMTEILACQGGDQAVQALASGWDGRSAWQRLIIVQQIGSRMAAKPRYDSFSSSPKPRKPSPQAIERAIELLVHALEDTETRYGITGGGPDLILGEACIGEFALQSLHQLDAAKYAFTPKAGRRLRDAERITAANLWRKEHGQPPLPMPPPPGPKLPPAEALKIVRVSLHPSDAPEAGLITQKAQSLLSTSFTPETMPQLLLWFAQANLPGVWGLDIEASRENDLTGVVIYLRAHLGQPKANDSPDWQTRHSGRAGENLLGNSSGSSSHAHVIQPDHWDEFQDAVREALKQPPQTEFRLHAELRHE